MEHANYYYIVYDIYFNACVQNYTLLYWEKLLKDKTLVKLVTQFSSYKSTVNDILNKKV